MVSGQKLEYRSLGIFGAEVLGVDIAAGCDAATIAELRASLPERELLLFRKQHPSDRELVAFASHFGGLDQVVLKQFTPPGSPEILIISNGQDNGRPLGHTEVGHFWHSDGSYLPELDMFSLLHGVTIPHAADGTPVGDTLFVSCRAAYDDLPAELKAKLAGRNAVFSYDWRYQQRVRNNPNVQPAKPRDERKDQRHPVIRPHPMTGRPAIFVNEGYVTHIEGVSAEESAALLAELYRRLYGDRYLYRHRWQAGDVLVWDNNSTQHNAVNDYRLPQLRLMKRITIRTAWPDAMVRAAG
jgi:taurine dioxygenase